MKLLWFHLMPYPDLPDDFQEKHDSVWIDIDSRLHSAIACWPSGSRNMARTTWIRAVLALRRPSP